MQKIRAQILERREICQDQWNRLYNNSASVVRFIWIKKVLSSDQTRKGSGHGSFEGRFYQPRRDNGVIGHQRIVFGDIGKIRASWAIWGLILLALAEFGQKRPWPSA